MASTVRGFTKSEMNELLCKDILRGINPDAQLTAWRAEKMVTTSYVSSFKEHGDRILGFWALHLDYQVPGADLIVKKTVVLKSKPTGKEVVEGFVRAVSERPYENHFRRYLQNDGFADSDIKEINCVSTLKSARINQFMPEVYFQRSDAQNGIFVLAMEYFDPKHFRNLDTLPGSDGWTDEDIHTVLHGMAAMHAVYYEKTADIPGNLLQGLPHKPGKYTLEDQQALHTILKRTMELKPDAWNDECCDMLITAVTNLEEMFKVMESCPRTLIHYDFSVRNVCLRDNTTEGKHRLCLYDWELAAIGPVQLDLVKFVCDILPEDADVKLWHRYVEVYIEYLLSELGREDKRSFNRQEFFEVFRAAVAESMVRYLNVSGYYNTVIPVPWCEKLVCCAVKYLKNTSSSSGFLNKKD